MVRVTILMPVYNGEKFLRETIDSVLNQTYTDFSFFIINDGSTDNSENIILSYSDTRILYYKNEKNLGLVATLNKGIDMIDTEFIARIDADDLWHESKLQKQIELLDARKDVGICGTSIHKFGAFSGDFIFPVDNEHLKVGFLFYCMMSHPSVIYRSKFLKESGLRYKTEYFPAEDYKMWIDSLLLTQIYNIPEILLYYRQHESQITQDTNLVQKSKADIIRLEMLDRIYSGFTEEQKSFHLYEFLAQKINSVSDYKKQKEWIKTLEEKNETNGKYMDSQVLEKELDNYLQVAYKLYILKKYFSKFGVQNFIRYFFSTEWVYLGLKRNMKLLLKHS